MAHEYVLVQSELYRESNPGQAVDYNKLLKAQWDAVVFNGYVHQYVDRPIHVPTNEKIRVWVMDDGPSDISSFHVIGTIFDSVYKGGAYLLQPSADQGGGQALYLASPQGASSNSPSRSWAPTRSSRTSSPTQHRVQPASFVARTCPTPPRPDRRRLSDEQVVAPKRRA